MSIARSVPAACSDILLSSGALTSVLILLLGVTMAPVARAGGGPLGIDSRLSYDNAGIWKRSNQEILIYGLMAAVSGTALWEGGQDRLGKTAWQSVDATVMSGAVTLALKYAFSRERPDQTSDPNRWFTGHGQSFPSGEVTAVTAMVTPFALEYGKDQPAVYALELLPVYDGIARMKVWGHWQTDVIAGFGIGFATAYLDRRLHTPLLLSVMPHGIQVGLRMQF